MAGHSLAGCLGWPIHNRPFPNFTAIIISMTDRNYQKGDSSHHYFKMDTKTVLVIMMIPWLAFISILTISHARSISSLKTDRKYIKQTLDEIKGDIKTIKNNSCN